MSALLVLALGACGGDDDAGLEEPPNEGEATEQQDAVADESTSEPVEASRYDLPGDYPLPTPEGGTLLSALFDDASGTSNVVIAYPSETLDGLIGEYDAFFDTVDGETVRVPLTDGLASWQNDTAGYSVILDAQNDDIQVRLQTGV